MPLPPPILSDHPARLLDHLEIRALQDLDGNASAATLISSLSITGSSDARPDDPEDVPLSEELAAIVDAVFTEAEDRTRHCGEGGYPFTIDGNSIIKQDTNFSRVYTFLVLLSAYGKDAVEGENGAKLFEDVCAVAAATYLGTSLKNDGFIFGFPRRIQPPGFPKALKKLCRHLREGTPDKKMPKSPDMKDAGLDIVIRKPFPDRKSSQLFAFGQCATGWDWWPKRLELQPDDWCREWLSKTPQVLPAKMFFVPHAVEASDWAHLGFRAGIIFDRLRIAYCCEGSISKSLRKRLRSWADAARDN